MDGWIDGGCCIEGWMDRMLDRWTYELKDGWTGGSMNGQIDNG